jgi:hypothetical protein
MKDEKLIFLPNPPRERPEFAFILSGCATDDERKALFRVAVQVYHLFPPLTRLAGGQMQMLVIAASIGTAFFIFTILVRRKRETITILTCTKGQNLMHVTACLIACKHAVTCNGNLPCAKRQGDKPKEGAENDTRNLANGYAIQIWTVLKQC